MRMFRYILAACLVFAVGFGANCVFNFEANAAAEPVYSSAIADRGDFRIGFAPSRRGRPSRRRELSAQDRLSLQEVADDLNRTFSLPRDIYIGYEYCDEANAYYNPNRHQIVICYELYEHFDEMFKAEYRQDAQRAKAVDDAVAFVFFHELGHALVHVYRLPIRGSEEDAVDQLSTLILTDGTEEGGQMAMHGAMPFGLLGDEPEEDLKYLDEHSLNSQRFENITCLIYGQNPQQHRSLIKNGALPKERAAHCQDEYRQVEQNWTKLLARYLKQQL